MNYAVVLAQRGISSTSHPVTGKSGRLYGTAVQSPEHSGVIFQMSMQDYLENAHDVVGNTEPHQQWVPEFVPVSHKAGPQKCDRCPKPAVASWGKYFYCQDHAPDNAVYLDGSGQVKKAPSGAGAEKPPQPDVAPVVEERLSKPVEEQRELPPEHLPAPAIGTDREEAPAPKGASGAFVPEKVKASTSSTSPSAFSDEPPAPAAPGKGQAVIEAITQGVVAAVMPQLEARIAELDGALSMKIAAATKAIEHKGKKKPSKPSQPRPETEFTKLQKRAKELGINSFGKKAEQLRSEINIAEQRPTH